jgi:arylsulfatase A-like enzyme
MKKLSRREFIRVTSNAIALASLSGVVGPLVSCSSSSSSGPLPNILLLMVDQMQTPPYGYEPNEGMAQGLKEILGFRQLSSGNAYARFFPGFMRLRHNAVVMRKHYTAASACVPSRSCIMTGQYAGITGVDQTDGMYKTIHDVPFLKEDGTPTIGDWFRAFGYKTHYFGKWHVSEGTVPDYLEPWGFEDWGKSYPEPHGGTVENFSGTFRDVGFADNVEQFLKEKGADKSGSPWLAVGSLVNPHDCGLMPVNWQAPYDKGVVRWENYPPPISIPKMGEKSLERVVNNIPTQIELNPDGFPQENGTLPRTYSESLDDKPRCQKDYSLKWGLALGANTDYNFKKLGVYDKGYKSATPFQFQGDYAKEWSLRYNQFYAYFHYLADRQLCRMLQALDDNNLSQNTIVVFVSDHGEMTGAHGGMIQKWHNAYEETTRVPLVVSSPIVNKNKTVMREIAQPTSSIDLAPTLLGLAGFHREQVQVVMDLVGGEPADNPFVGADLSAHLKGETNSAILGGDGNTRPGVVFMSNDMVTEIGAQATPDMKSQHELFFRYVDEAISNGHQLAPGTVRQPNHVRALCTGDWKIARYFDPKGIEADEWELYCLTNDPVEQENLVDFRTGEVRSDVTVPGMTTDQLKLKNAQLKRDLAAQETVLQI